METNTQNSMAQRNKYVFKGLFISALVLGLMIPTFFINGLIRERKNRLEEVKWEVSNKWSGSQTIEGPMLIVPYVVKTITHDNKIHTERKLAYILPDELNIEGELKPEIRYRSIYKIAVYNSKMNVTGHFAGLPFQKLNIKQENILINEAEFVIGISDFRGINEQVKMEWNSEVADMNAGIITNEQISDGLSVPVKIDTTNFERKYNFAFPLQLKGSELISATPVGKTTTMKLKSSWPNPEFTGNFLPETREISDSGFQAEWKVLHLNRDFPQFWKDQYYNISQASFGLNLLQPVDAYAQSMRTIKYAILVIFLTFAIYYFVEIFQRKMVHPVQYVLVGFALCIFYLLVLSVSEYLDFIYAYLIAAGATILMIAAYTSSIFRSIRTGIVFGGFMSALYAFIYILIRMQDGALLVGSIGLFVILSAIMFFSRKVDWYGNAKTT